MVIEYRFTAETKNASFLKPYLLTRASKPGLVVK
jgi:hypothetical protein